MIERVATGEERLAVRLESPPGGIAPLAVLYLHGFGSRQEGEKASYFRERALAAGWAFCSFDFRGHGASEGSLRQLTFTRCLEDVAAVRGWLVSRGHGRLALLGSSMGGAVGLWHAGDAPEGIVAAAHVAPALGLAAGMERWAGPERMVSWERDGVVRYASETVETELGWELMRDLRRYDPAELERRHRVPALLFQGQLDDTVDWRDVAEFAARAAPGSVQLRLFPDGGHRLTDRLETLWCEAADWFRRHTGDSRERRAVRRLQSPPAER